MNITDADLAAVRAVLTTNGKSLKEVAEEYSAKQSALVVATILLATPRRSFGRGDYSKILQALVVEPGAPTAGWPRNADNGRITPEWYARKAYTDGLIAASRRLKLHTSPGRSKGTTLEPVPELLALLAEDRRYGEVARHLYETHWPDAATATQSAAPPGDTKEALEAQLRALHAATGAIYATLGELLAAHFPK